MEKREKEKKLSKRDFIIVILMIFFLSGFSFWHFKNWKKSISEFKPPKFEIPKPEIFPKKEGYKEWISPDGKLKMKYKGDWIEMKKEFFGILASEEKGETLFFAQKFIFEKGAQGFLVVRKINSKDGMNLKEFIENMKRETESKGGKMEILHSVIKEDTATLEIKYEKMGKPSLHSKEKIFLGKEAVYLVTFFTFEKNWDAFQQETEEIINNIQFLE